MPEPAVEVAGLDFAYGDQPVLSGVDLTVPAGDFVALLGPNGGGKTTLVKLLLGLLKPRRGRISVLGRPPGLSWAEVGYVPQVLAGGLDFPITAGEVVLLGRLGPRHRGLAWSAEDKRAAQAALEGVGLWDLRRELLSRLSGGQRQRVLIARALAAEPKLLMLDEPTASVDQEWQVRFFSLLQELNQAMTIILVSHDLAVVSSQVKSVACVNQTVFYHPAPEITPRMLSLAYRCPVELIAHGLPHRVLAEHGPAPGQREEDHA